MSTLKVEEIQHLSNSNNAVSIASDSSVSLKHSGSAKLATTATGVSVIGTCAATAYTGDGSALTGISSGITVQDEGSALSTAGTTFNFVGAGVTASGTGASKTITIPGGGGSFEYVDKLETSTTVTSLSKSGLEYDKLYRIWIPEITYNTTTHLDIAPMVDNNTTPANANDCAYVNHVGITNRSSSGNSSSQNYWRVDLAGWQSGAFGAYFDVYTSDKCYIIGNYLSYGTGVVQYAHGSIYGTKGLQSNTENDSNQTGTYAKTNGFKIFNANGWSITNARILIYKYKES